MTALYIIAAIIFLIWLLLFQFVTVDFSFLGGNLKVKVKYLFFTVFDLNKYLDEKESDSQAMSEKLAEDNSKANVASEIKQDKKAAHKYSEDKSKDKKNKEKKSKDKPEKPKNTRKKTIEDRLFELGDKIDFIKGLYDIGIRPVFKILKGIHLTRLFIDFDIADEDAYDCAIKFGNMNALVFNAVGSLACLFTVKKKSIDIHCVYDTKPAKYDASFYLRLRPTTVLSAGISFGIKYLIYFIIKPNLQRLKNNKKKKNKNNRAAAKTA